ncbi:hypothetical protein V1291_005295 [Nitrobacteraceae bacterium AZCC 1564]
MNHPLDLFAYPQMKETIETLIGGGENTIKNVVNGPGSIEHRDDLFVAESCLPHHCVSDVIIFVLDAKNKAVFVAWKLSDKPLAIRPSIEQWTPQVRTELDRWAERLRENEAFLTSLKTRSFAPSNTAADDLLDDLRSKRLSKPEDIFKHSSMTIPVETLLAGYRETVMSMVRGGQGTVEYKGNVIIGTSCVPNECSDKSLMFAVDPTSEQVFFAWKTPGNPIVVKPPVKEWTQPAKAELAAWSKRWTEATQNGGKKTQ